MSKKIYILLIILLFTTGCTCQYNLKIDGNTYQEELTLNASTREELNQFNNNWQIPIDKDIYFCGDEDTNVSKESELYKTQLTGNRLTFSHEFNRSDFQNSTAAAICYDKLTVSNYSNSTVISTSKIAQCFENYNSLSNLVINITVDRPVKSNNADSVSGNTYTWNINRNNASNKPVNLVLGASENNDYVTPAPSSSDNSTNIEPTRDYSMYIFSAILLLVFLIGYAIYKKMKNKEEKI